MKCRVCWVLILLVFHQHSRAQNFKAICRILDSANSADPFFGNVLITKKGKVVIEKSYGFADAKNNLHLTSKSSFQIASISKQFTAYGIMLLKHKGKLSYDSMVFKYLSSFPYKNISLRHLLNHTSGLPDFWNQIRPNLDTTKSNGNQDLLDYLIQHQLPLQHQPGIKFSYADIGYDLLALVIESVSEMKYNAFLDQMIFKPLGMTDTYAYLVTDFARIQNKNLAIGHTLVGNHIDYAHLQPKYHFVFYLGDFYGDGSIVSSAKDLSKWSNALRDGTLLPNDVQNEAFIGAFYNDKKVFVRADSNIEYGFGWFINRLPDETLLYHTGGHPGNVHAMYRFIEKDICLIFLSNAETPNVKVLRSRIIQMLK